MMKNITRQWKLGLAFLLFAGFGFMTAQHIVAKSMRFTETPAYATAPDSTLLFVDSDGKIKRTQVSGSDGAELGYSVYTALLNQSGTDAPVADVLQNTLPGTPVWSYNDVGQYQLTLMGAFPVAKTAIITGQGNIFIYTESIDDAIILTTRDNSFAYANGAMYYLAIEIRVYP